MKVSATELPPRQVALEIEVDQERLDKAIDEAFRRLSGRVEVPGFRRGKAPRGMVERMIGRDRIVEDALDHLVPDVVSEAMQQEKLEPYTRPRVESIEFDPLRLKAVVGLAPKVELGDYKDNLRVPPEEVNVTDEQVEAVIQRLRESYAQWVPVDRAVTIGDQIGIDLRVELEERERPLVDQKDAPYIVDPTGPAPAPGFVDQVVGMSPGDTKTFTLTMPDNYAEKDAAGKPAQFEVTLHWVKERELPELDDAFASQVGDYSDVSALRTTIESQLRQREEDRVREKLEEAAMNKLVEISQIEFPPQLIEHQAQHMLETFTRNVEQQGLQLTQYLRLVGKEQDAFEQELKTEAESRIRRSLALDAFAEAEHIDVEQQEVEDEVRRAAASTPESEAVERVALANPATRQRVQEVTRERKAISRLLQLATGDLRNGGGKKPPEQAVTSDTQTAEPPKPPSEEDEGNA